MGIGVSQYGSKYRLILDDILHMVTSKQPKKAKNTHLTVHVYPSTFGIF